MLARLFFVAVASLAMRSLVASHPIAGTLNEDPAPGAPNPAKPLLTPIPPTHLSLAVPPTFVREGRALIWVDDAAGMSFTVREDTSADLSLPPLWAEYLDGAQEKEINRTEVDIGGVRGLLFTLADRNVGLPPPIRMAVAKQGGLQLVIRAYAKPDGAPALDKMFAALLRDSVWDTRAVVDPLAAFPWTIAVPKGLECDKNEDDAIRFVRRSKETTGVAPYEAMIMLRHTEPRLAVKVYSAAAGRQPLTPEDQITQLLPGLSARVNMKLVVRESRAVTLDGKSAWEVVYSLTDTATKSAVVGYMVVVATEEFEVTLMCSTRAATESTWLPRFRSCVRTWKSKPAVQVAAPK